MANTVQKTILLQGNKVLLHVYLQSDGVSGELVDEVLFDPQVDAVPPIPPGRDLNVEEIWYELSGFSGTFSFQGLTDWPFWVLAPGTAIHHDWKHFGGIKDHTPTNPTGRLLLNTSGFFNPGARGAFVLRIKL